MKGQGVSRAWSTLLYDVRLRKYGASNWLNFRILAFVGGTCAPPSALLVCLCVLVRSKQTHACRLNLMQLVLFLYRQQLRVGKLPGTRLSNRLLLRWILRTYRLQSRTSLSQLFSYIHCSSQLTYILSKKINACYIFVCIFFQICQNSNF